MFRHLVDRLAGLDIHAGNQKYRPDIDGLRALAVMLVVAFHVAPGEYPKWALFSGGFIGVDIFFTISGFLISSIIINGLEAGRFSFLDFYARRVRRIFPALLCTLAGCLALGAVLLLTNEFQELCRYIAASTVFVANLVLWRSVGYFNTAAELQPSLHLWSLGVEEQFYILWPPALYIAMRLRMHLGYFLLASFLLSFGADVWILQSHAASAFYFPFLRFFELIIGAGLAYLTVEPLVPNARALTTQRAHRVLRPALLRNTLSMMGAALIALAVFSFNSETAFPGWRALLPTMGCAAIIAAGPQAWLNRKLLAHPLMVLIGLVSYPLYLWHWPLLSFLRITIPNPGKLMRLAAVLLAVFLALASYVLVERPLRFGRSKWIVPGLCIAMAGLGLAAICLAQWPGLNLRGDPRDIAQLKWEDNDPACDRLVGVEQEARYSALFCFRNTDFAQPSVAVLGDSMANALYPGLRDAYAARGMGVINLGNATCAPFRNLYGAASWNRDCKIINDKIYAYVAANKNIKTVILGIASWGIGSMYFDAAHTPLTLAQKFERMTAQVNADIAFLRAHGKTVTATFDGPRFPSSPRYCMLEGKACDVEESIAEQPDRLYTQYWLSVLGGRQDVCLFRQAPLLKEGHIYRLRRDGVLVFRDDHHLSMFGSRYIADALLKSDCLAGKSKMVIVPARGM